MTYKPAPFYGAEHLIEIPRRPEETLHEYLVRSQRVLADRVRMVARGRDAAEYFLDLERARLRQDRIILILAGPFIAAAAYVGLARAGITEFARFEFIAGVIAMAGVTGGAFVLACANLGPKFGDWLLSLRWHRVMRFIRRRR